MKDFKSDIIHCLEQKDWNKAMKRLKEWEADGSHNEPDFYFFQGSFGWRFPLCLAKREFARPEARFFHEQEDQALARFRFLLHLLFEDRPRSLVPFRCAAFFLITDL